MYCAIIFEIVLLSRLRFLICFILMTVFSFKILEHVYNTCFEVLFCSCEHLDHLRVDIYWWLFSLGCESHFLFLCMPGNIFYCILRILKDTLYDFWIQLSFFEECGALLHQAVDSVELKLQTQTPLLWIEAETPQFLQLPGWELFAENLGIFPMHPQFRSQQDFGVEFLCRF